MNAPGSAPTKTPTSIHAVGQDATWLAHRYDPGFDAIHFLRVPRATHAQVTFLTEAHLPAGLPTLVVKRGDAIASRPPEAPLHWVFHSAYCCSTLVARAFDRPGWAMGLKEPTILNDVVGWRRRGGGGKALADVLRDALALLARPFTSGEAVVVKPSNVVNGLAEAALTLRPESNAVLLHAPLKTYLASVAKKGIDGRLWVRTLLLGLLDDDLVDLGLSGRDYIGLTDLQVAAVGWLAQQALFTRLATTFGPARVRTVDSATLLADVDRSIAALATLFRLPHDAQLIRAIAGGPAFTRHSKDGVPFSLEDRTHEHRSAADLHADEIAKVSVWAEHLAESAGIPAQLPCPLLEEPA